MPNTPRANNRVAVGLLVKQGWRAKRAYPVYDMQRENKAVGLGLFKPLKLGRVEEMFCPLELEGFSIKTDQPRWGCYGWVPLKQGRLVLLANPALPTDQPRWGCLRTVFPIGDKYNFSI